MSALLTQLPWNYHFYHSKCRPDTDISHRFSRVSDHWSSLTDGPVSRVHYTLLSWIWLAESRCGQAGWPVDVVSILVVVDLAR